jgi:hypothetical protein
MPIYTVVGIYTDTYQQFCHLVHVDEPEDAVMFVRREFGDELLIAGVFEGDIEPVL